MISSPRIKLCSYTSVIAIVAWLCMCMPAVAQSDDNEGDIRPTTSVSEPSMAMLTGVAIGGLAVARWLRNR